VTTPPHRCSWSADVAVRPGRPGRPSRYQLGATEIINAALVDDAYRPVNPIVLVVM